MKNTIYYGPVAICKFSLDEKLILQNKYLTCNKLTCEMYKKKLIHGLICNLCGHSLILREEKIQKPSVDVQKLINKFDNNMMEISSFISPSLTKEHYWISNTIENTYSNKINCNDGGVYYFLKNSIQYALEDFSHDNSEYIASLYEAYGKDNVSIDRWIICVINQ